MASQGSLITSTDYNALVDQLTLVLGTGAPNGPGTASPNFGYNQALQSKYVTPGTTITDFQWQQIQNDLTKAYLHQNGTSPALVPLSSSKLITYGDVANVSPYLSGIVATPNAVATNQLTQSVLSTIVYGSPWGSGSAGITTTASVTFKSSAIRQYFMNQGGKIIIQGVGPTQNGTKQNQSWSNLLRSVTYTIDVNEMQLVQTAINNGTTFPERLNKTSSYYAAYSSNYVSIKVSLDNSGSIYFNVTYYDSHIGTSDYVNSGAGFIMYLVTASGAFPGYTPSAYSNSTLSWQLI